MKIKKIKRSVESTHTYDIEVGGKFGTHSYKMSNGNIVHNSTNGIEPPKALSSVKDSVPTVVPEVNMYFMDYEPMWEIVGNKGYIDLVAIMQKFIDQSISANTHYDPNNYRDNKVPVKEMMDDILYAHYYGVKTLYYHYTNDDANDTESDDDCESCKV